MLLVACFRIQLRYSMCFCVVVSDLLDCAQHKNLADFLLAGVTHESVAERFTNTAEEVVAFLLCEVLLVALKFADGIDHDPAIVEDRDSAGGTRILVREEESGNLGNPFLPFPDETTLTMSTGSIELGGHFVCVPPIFCHHDAFSWKDSLAFRRCSSCTAISL